MLLVLGCCCLHMIETAGGSAHKSVLSSDVLAGPAVRVSVQTASLSLAIVQPCTDQKVPKVLGAISHDGGSGVTCFRCLKAWRIIRVRAVRCGRVGWYDTTSGVLLFVTFFSGGLRVSSWQRYFVHSICCCMVGLL